MSPEKKPTIDDITLTYLDSAHPGTIVMWAPVRTVLSISDAAKLADRLLTAIRSSGYDLGATKSKR